MDSSSEQHATLQSTSDRQVQVKLEGGSEEDAKREDVITLIEQDLSLLLRILTSSIHYISTRSSMVQLSDSIPLSRPTGAAGAYANSNMVERATMKESIDELTDDLIQKAKDIETLVDRLPVTQDEEAFQSELQGLDEEMKVANEEYRSALQEASKHQKSMFPKGRRKAI